MIELACPWILAALPIPILIWFFSSNKDNIYLLAVRVPFFNLINNQSIISSMKLFRLFYWFIIWSLLLLALSGPRWIGPPAIFKLDGYNIMLALDISPSMAINDMVWRGQTVSRFQVVQYTAEKFVNERLNDKIGLILFGERAYLLTPLTYDHQTILNRLSDATVGLAGKSTSIGDALGVAIKRLNRAPKKGRIIILLTDGVNNSGMLSPLKAAELAKQDDIKVYTIGLGSGQQSLSFDKLFLNRSPEAELDEETLTKIADLTGGQYFRANSLSSLENIYQRIHEIAEISQAKPSVRPQKEYYPWPLSMALILWFLDLGRIRFKYFVIKKRGK